MKKNIGYVNLDSSIALVSNHLGIFRPDSVCLRESI